MDYIEGMDRRQTILLPEAIEDYIGTENPVRFIEVFVEGLDLRELGFRHSDLKETGRPPYNPGDLLKMYIYGYLNRERSSRGLEREAGRNVELMWLMRKLRPDFKTIADFRKDNKGAIRGVCREFTMLCRQMDLFGGEIVAIDGSKFRAVNSKKRNFNEKKFKRSIKDIEDKIDKYLDEMDENDRKEEGVKRPSKEDIEAAIEKLKERKGKYKDLLKEMKERGDRQVSLTDPDSRLMKKGCGTEVSYNVQTVVDDKHKLIVEHEVTNEGHDSHQLSKMAKMAKETLGVDRLEVLVDKGYYDSWEIKECEDNGIDVYVEEKRSKSEGKNIYHESDFRYDSGQDIYICPAKKEMRCTGRRRERNNRVTKVYSARGCKRCELKDKCTEDRRGRRIYRWEHEDVLDKVRHRMKMNRDKMKMRQMLIEHPFGTIKRAMNQGYMLMRRLENVRGEFSLTVLAYNIKRVMNIIGVKDLVKELA